MSWRDRLLPASIGDVPFFVESADATGGRRVDIKPYPLRDGSFVRDIGQRSRMYNLRAFLVGDDYDLDLRRLEAKLNEAGPYDLVHPYRGTILVSQRGEYQVSESADNEGGFATIQISLIQHEDEIYPSLADPTSRVIASADVLAFAAVGAFEGFNLGDAINSVVGKVHKALADLSSAILSAKGKITSVANVPLTTISLLDQIAEQMTDLIEAPGNLAQSIIGGLTDLFRALPDADDPATGADRAQSVAAGLGLEILGDAVSFRTDPVVGTGVQAQVEIQLKGEIEQLFKFAIVSALTAALPSMQLDSGADAKGFAAEFAEKVGTIQASVPLSADEVFLAAENAKAAVHQFTLTSAQDLPRVINVFVPIDTPALVLAYNLLGDAQLADDIVRRNRIRNPNAVPGGTTIEVLVDG